jgi:hypothetical protein
MCVVVADCWLVQVAVANNRETRRGLWIGHYRLLRIEVKGEGRGATFKADEKLKNETHLGRNANPLNAGQ